MHRQMMHLKWFVFKKIPHNYLVSTSGIKTITLSVPSSSSALGY